VVALYNPKSSRRAGQIVEAQRIPLRYRRPDTPVAVVKSAYRDRQEIQMVRLDRINECKIGMLTTVLIGNSSSDVGQGLMIAPRGYARKCDSITGDAIQGEKAGRSLSMGMDGRRACVRPYLRDSDAHSLRDIARHFGVRMGEILEAIAELVAVERDATAEALGPRAGEFLNLKEAWGKQ